MYQGRYKSFPVDEDEHFMAVARYVERNPLRANLVVRAEDWRWSSLWRRSRGSTEQMSLAAWPIEMPADWIERVNRADNQQELEALYRSVQRGRPRRGTAVATLHREASWPGIRIPFARSSSDRENHRSGSRTMMQGTNLPMLPISDPARFLSPFSFSPVFFLDGVLYDYLRLELDEKTP